MTPDPSVPSPLWQARDSRAALLLLPLPLLSGGLLLGGTGGFFLSNRFAAWLAAAPGAPQLATVTMQLLEAGLVTLAGAALVGLALGLPLTRWRRRYALDAHSIAIHRGGYTARHRLDAVLVVAVRDEAWWRRARWSLGYGRIAPMLLSGRDAAALAEALEGLGVALSGPKKRGPHIADLAADETISWHGKRGFAGFEGWQLLLPLIGVIPPTLLVWALWAIWTARPIHWTAPIVFTVILLLFFGPLGIGTVLLFGPKLLDRVFGRLLLTDRRLLWCAPWSPRVYREVARAEIVDAVIVERDGARGWVGLSIDGRKGVTEIEIKGVPDPDGLVAALGFAR